MCLGDYLVTVSKTCLPLAGAVLGAGVSFLRTIEVLELNVWNMAEHINMEKKRATKYMPTQNRKG